MATTGRIVYHGDDETIKKEKREFSLTDEIMELINSGGGGGGGIQGVKVNGQVVDPDQAGYVGLTIPGVINTLSSNSTSDALSAKQGKVLYEYIQALQHVGHFLALWNTATGLPVTNPETSPYTYNTGDYYIVSNIAAEGGTNYKPNGSSYTINVASTTVESGDVQVNDLYFYDGYERRLLDNSGGGSSIAVDSSLSTTSTNPVQNMVITNRLNQMALDANTKTFFLANGNDLTAAQAAYDWIRQGKMALVTLNGETYIYKTTASNKATFEDVGGYTTIDNNGTTGVYLKTLELSLNGTTVEQISLSTKSQSSIIPSYLATDKNYATAYVPQYDGSPATKKYVDDKFSAVPVYTAGSNIDITSNQISTIRNGYVYVTCNDAATTKAKTGTSAEGNYTPQEGDLIMIHFVNGCSVGGPTIAIDGGTAIPFYIGVEGANAGNMYFGSNNVSKMFIYTDGKLVGDAVKDNNTVYYAGTGLALSNGVFSNTQPGPTVSATAPASPSEGDMRYDTDNDVLKVYNGSSWDEAGGGEAIDLVAGDGIIINSIGSDLPDGYTQLQSISSSGSQYILTGINYVSGHTYEFTHKLFVNSATEASKGTGWNAGGGLMMINQSGIKYSGGGTSSLIGDAGQELEVTISVGNGTSTYDYKIGGTTGSLSRSNTSLASYAGSTPYPLFVSTVNNGGGTIYNGTEMTATYYYFEAKDNNVLVRKMYPAKRNADNAIGMYDVVNNVFYANSGSGSFVPGPMVPVGGLEISAIPYVGGTDIEVVLGEAKRLPNGYTEVEYIQSDGNCYIDTLVNTAGTDYIENHFQKLGSSTTTCAWFGSWEGNTLIRFCIGSYSSQQIGPCFFGGYNYTSPIGTLNTNKNIIKFYYNGGTYYQTLNDGVPNTYSPQNTGTNPTITSYMFARHGADGQDTTYDNEGTKIFYHLQKDVNGVNKMELIPCVRDSDDEPGFYDLVNERFLANSGSGTLTAGPEVTYNPANVINYTGGTSNTKTFFFSGNLMDQSNLETALSIIDWLYDGDMPSSWSRPIDKNPIVVYNDGNGTYNKAFHLEGIYDYSGGLHMVFERTIGNVDDYHLGQIEHEYITLSITGHSTSNIALYDHYDYKNFLSTTNTISYTPTADYNPATKKYVDDTVGGITIPSIAVVNNSSVVNATPSGGDLHTLTLSDTANTVTKSYVDGKISSGTTAPSSPTEGMLWYDTTNDVLKVYDGTNWNVVGSNTDTSNTKTFYLSSTSDLTNAQAVLDWYNAGKNPIIIYSNRAFHVRSKTTTVLSLASLTLPSSGNSYNSIYNQAINIVYSNNTVTSINYDNTNIDASTFLSTSTNYSTPYTPQYDGSPATKKYVDDTVGGAISKGTTAPSSPSEGQLWYDTTNDVLKVYNGTAWVAVGGSGGVDIKNVTVATAYNTAAKVGTTTAGNYTPTAGDLLMVNFVNGCSTSSAPTLNIDGSGANNIRVGNISATSTYFSLGTTSSSNVKVLMYFDGTYYKVWSTQNSTYSSMSQSTASTGTSTTGNLITAKVLNDTIVEKAITLDPNSPLDVTTIWAGTESQYNSLSSKGPTTAYLCVEE